jgi:hypothetical protein
MEEIRNSDKAKEKNFWALWDAVQMDYEDYEIKRMMVGSLQVPRVM